MSPRRTTTGDDGPTPDQIRAGRALAWIIAVLCGLTAAFVVLVVVRVIAPHH